MPSIKLDLRVTKSCACDIGSVEVCGAPDLSRVFCVPEHCPKCGAALVAACDNLDDLRSACGVGDAKP